MSFSLFTRMAKSKICHIRHYAISSVRQNTSTTNMAVPMISQFSKNRLMIENEFSPALGLAIVPTMLKRENYNKTQHDTIFSNWKLLIGSKDWEDYKKSVEGLSRYRIQNLPGECCPGLYELGVAVIGQDQGRKLDAVDVLPSYLGHTGNIRPRLQDYGRCGSHLPNTLFEDVFSNEGSIVCRWAQMRSKREAEATEAIVLCKFDYAWNYVINGERRHLDLLKKLCDREFMNQRKLRSDVDVEKKSKQHDEH